MELLSSITQEDKLIVGGEFDQDGDLKLRMVEMVGVVQRRAEVWLTRADVRILRNHLTVLLDDPADRTVAAPSGPSVSPDPSHSFETRLKRAGRLLESLDSPVTVSHLLAADSAITGAIRTA